MYETPLGDRVSVRLSLRVLLPLFFDAVSYGCGLVRVQFHWFMLATASESYRRSAASRTSGRPPGARRPG